MHTHRNLITAAIVMVSAITIGAQAGVSLPAHFSAIAMSTGDAVSRPVADQVQIDITRWSSAAETERLMTVLREKGADKMLDDLREMHAVGTIRTPGSLAYDLHYAHVDAGEDGGYKVLLATDRPISFWEAVNRPRTIDYPFTFIELHLDKNGEGEGKLALATKISLSRDGKSIELENYQTQPIMLNEVKRHGN